MLLLLLNTKLLLIIPAAIIPKSIFGLLFLVIGPMAVQRVLLDFGFNKLFNKRLAFPSLYGDFYILLLATSKDHWVPRMLFVL